MLSPSAPAVSGDALTSAIHDYILAHPEVVLESVRAYDVRKREVAEEKVRDKVRAHMAELTQSEPGLPGKGAEGKSLADKDAAPVTVIEFFDYRCGYCKKAADTVLGLEKMPGVRVVYKDLPILGGDCLIAAQAALAAGKQGGYDKLHNAMLASQAPLTAAAIEKLAAEIGLDVPRLKTDMRSPEVNAEIARNEQLAEALDVQATPTFVVGDQLVSGALTKFGGGFTLMALCRAARLRMEVSGAISPGRLCTQIAQAAITRWAIWCAHRLALRAWAMAACFAASRFIREP